LPPTGTSRGTLRPDDGSGMPQSARYLPSAAVGVYVEHYWTVRWSQPAPARRAVLSHPAIHLTVEDGDGRLHGHDLPAALVHGVVRGTFEVDLTPSGWVFGARFRPGGFTALTGIGAGGLTDHIADAGDVLDGADALRSAVLAASDDAGRITAFDEWLTPRLPAAVDPTYARTLQIVAGMLDRTVHRAEDVAASEGCSLRTLQRLFERYVGVGPKWLITRYRLHDALALIDSDESLETPVDLAALAAELGWFDQAHFTRDFTAHVGVSPQAYRARPR